MKEVLVQYSTIDDDGTLSHIGTKRHSGRYEYGSGNNAEQHNRSFLGGVADLVKQGLSEKEIAQGYGMTTSELRAKKSRYKDVVRAADTAFAVRLLDKGYSKTAIGERMGINESSVRSLLKPSTIDRANITQQTVTMLKDQVSDKNYLDVGKGSEHFVGISKDRMKTAIDQLKDEGYKIHYIQVDQQGTSNKTSLKVLAGPDSDWVEVNRNKHDIKNIESYTEDGGRSFLGLEPIHSLKSSQLQVVYAEDGGTERDGLIEVRRGIKELSLGQSRYAQVRIGVDGTHYAKGMAVYADDLPPGINARFNTNKSKTTAKLDTLKKMKTDADGNIDTDNPFGASVKQRHYIDTKTGKLEVSQINIVNEEGDWSKWSKNTASQMLSKQSPALAKKQLKLAYDIKQAEYDEIMSLTNPAVKKKLLDSFSDDVDSAAVHLKGAALPRQSTNVFIPFPGLKDNEVYAPNLRDGEEVVIIRYPHGGTFEIPVLKVNNKFAPAIKTLGNAKDAIGINAKVAEILSGADFDGDAGVVIPTSNAKIKATSVLKGLENFDPKVTYPAYEGMPQMSARTKSMKMGDASNLITDMTIKGANIDEIARAVRHSMVVIDAEKHHLNYKQSHIDNGIGALKAKYQGSARSGASTLISKAGSQERVNTRKVTIDPETGKKKYEYTNESYTKVIVKTNKKTGDVTETNKTIYKTTTSNKMAETDDAFFLSSGTPMETVYATHANKLKMLANESRKASIATKYTKYDPVAKKVYEEEVKTLKAKLKIAETNAPRERAAQLLADKVVRAKVESNPHMENATLKRIKGQALEEARVRSGAKKKRIDITDREWEAIQSGAVSTSALNSILSNTDLNKIKTLATPRTNQSVPKAKINKAQDMLIRGYTTAQVADAIGVSPAKLNEALDE